MHVPLALAVMDPRDTHPFTFDFTRMLPPGERIVPDSVSISIDPDSEQLGVQTYGPLFVSPDAPIVTVYLRVGTPYQGSVEFDQGHVCQVTVSFLTTDDPVAHYNRSGAIRIRRR